MLLIFLNCVMFCPEIAIHKIQRYGKLIQGENDLIRKRLIAYNSPDSLLKLVRP